MMFYEQQDMAVLFGVLLAPWALFEAIRTLGQDKRVWVGVAVPAVLTVLALIAVPFFRAKEAYIDQVAVTEKSPEQRWDFATGWSWPPEESVEFLVSGYKGWKSGDPDGPYFGRLGQSSQWEKTRKGLPNLRGEGLYLGLPVMLLAWFGLWAGWSLRRSDRWLWRTTVFWQSATAVLFLLPLGKLRKRVPIAPNNPDAVHDPSHQSAGNMRS